MTLNFRPTLETERLVLRPLQPEDARALLAIFSDEEVMKYWNTAPWTSLDDATGFIATSIEAMERGESITLGVVLRATGELIGKCMLFGYVPESRRAEIGFGLGRRHWGNGFIPEAGQALLDYGFDSLGLRRVEAEIDPDNVPSGRTLERLGFVREGLLRQRWEIAGVVSDSALYGLLADDRSAHDGSRRPAPLPTRSDPIPRPSPRPT